LRCDYPESFFCHLYSALIANTFNLGVGSRPYQLELEFEQLLGWAGEIMGVTPVVCRVCLQLTRPLGGIGIKSGCF